MTAGARADDPLLIDVPELIEGSRVRLRPFRPGDGLEVFPAVEESRAEIAAWQDWHEGHRSPADSERAIRRLLAKFFARECLYFAVRHAADDRFLGWVGVEDIDWRVPSFSVGCWLRTSAGRRGLMTEALALLCRVCFETLAAKRVALLAESDNSRSVALALRLGFVREGELRNERLNMAGQPQNTLVFALTPEDYAKRSATFRSFAADP